MEMQFHDVQVHYEDDSSSSSEISTILNGLVWLARFFVCRLIAFYTNCVISDQRTHNKSISFFYIQCFNLYCASYQFMSAFAVQIVLCLLGLIDSNLNKLINFSKYVIVVEKRQEEKGKEG